MMDDTGRTDLQLHRLVAELAVVAVPLDESQGAAFALLLGELESGVPCAATVWAALRAAGELAASRLSSPSPPTSGWSAELQPLPGLGSTLCVRRQPDGSTLRFRLDNTGTPRGALTLETPGNLGVLEIAQGATGLQLRGFAGDRELSVVLGDAPEGCWTSRPATSRFGGELLAAFGAGPLSGLLARQLPELPQVPAAPSPGAPQGTGVAPDPARPPCLRLALLSGPTLFEPVPLTRRVVIGREADCDLRLDDPGVSRHHAAVEPTPEGARVTDLGSSNGTYLNRRRIEALVEAREGDEIVVGHTHLVLAGGPRAVPKVSDGLAQSPEPAPVPPATPFQPPEKSPRHCRRCGRPEPDAAMRFCCACGQPLEAATAAVPPSCASCGRELHPGERFCRSCGRKVG